MLGTTSTKRPVTVRGLAGLRVAAVSRRRRSRRVIIVIIVGHIKKEQNPIAVDKIRKKKRGGWGYHIQQE